MDSHCRRRRDLSRELTAMPKTTRHQVYAIVFTGGDAVEGPASTSAKLSLQWDLRKSVICLLRDIIKLQILLSFRR